MPAIRYQRHPLAPRDTPWDGPREVAAADVDDLKVMCTWYDPPGERKGDYKLPHHRQSDKYTVWRGVTAAMAALLGARGGVDIPASDRRGVYNHLARHYRDFDEEPPEFRQYSDAELREMFMMEEFPEERQGGMAMTRAQVQPIAQDEQEVQRALAIINEKFARRPLSPEEIYLFPAELSNQHVDWYGTRMTAKTLQNYAADAKAGVPLMNSHRTGRTPFSPPAELPLGRSYDAHLVGKPVEGERAASTPLPLVPSEAGQRLIVNYYIVRGLKLGEVDSDNAIRGIETGVITDVSIGFRPGWYRCAICGQNYLSAECEHIALLEYDGQLCFVWVEEGRLIEGSLVYAGATPEAMIRKAREFAPRLSRPEVALLEDRYQTRLLDDSIHVVRWMVNDKPKRKEVNEVPETVEAVDITGVVRERAPELLALLGDEITVEALVDAAEKLRAEAGQLKAQVEELQAQLEEMKPRAERGDRYLEDLVEQAVKARVRAQGDGFDADRYRAKLLADGDVDFIKGEIAAYEGQVRERFQPGRQVKPQGEKSQKPAQANLYKV